ncbi:class I SAM-dependent methyltransferase [Crateriforma conspicua]|uniref:Ubiquinone/menaquinone biosynthesis methyltransferase n=1 Tax=Crateriforma conspicua TaxID=2527996 RepID=A0A5C6FPT7_9PLAN|nr:class I SAM-dependent methyltransferase [Crateriforma conspicua]TWU65132.1 ubiquinone/menaquinone biosynthesis methyltransferase [Crateriforma conspicua]
MKQPDGYDRLAKWYRWVEWSRFGGRLQRARQRGLDDLPASPNAVLFVGDGDGRLLESFLQRFAPEQVVSVDYSRQMLLLQRKRIDGAGWSQDSNASTDNQSVVRFVQADSRQLPIERRFDVVVTAFHLDCFVDDELDDVVRQIGCCVQSDGVWYVVDFIEPRGGLTRWWAVMWSNLMIIFFRYATGLETRRLPDVSGAMGRAGWQKYSQRRDFLGWIDSSVYRRRIDPSVDG